MTPNWDLEDVKFPFNSLYVKVFILNIFGEIKGDEWPQIVRGLEIGKTMKDSHSYEIDSEVHLRWNSAKTDEHGWKYMKLRENVWKWSK